MTAPRDASETTTRRPNGRRYVGEIVLGAAVLAGAFVFFRPHPTVADKRSAAEVSRDSVAEASRASVLAAQQAARDSLVATNAVRRGTGADSAEHNAAMALKMSGPVLSPETGFPDTLQFDAAYRARQSNLCLERASGDVSSGGQGTGAAALDHAGMAGDSLAFDGVARSTTGRAMVWRCTFSTKVGDIGRMMFTSADSVPGLVLAWNPIATLDDYVLRRCMVRAQKLLADKVVLPHASGRRRDDQVRLMGGAEGGGLSLNWSCGATVHGDGIVALDARIGG